MQPSRLAAVGAFVVMGVALFAVGLFLIGDRRMLFADTFEVYAEFAEIAGLQKGAKVRVAGMDAGEVETIQVPAAPSKPFRVKLRIREDLHQIIRLDSIASIQNDGLVGNKFVQVEAGTEPSAVVPELGTIRSREPFEIGDLFQQMSETIDTVNAAIAEVRSQVDVALASISAAAKDAQTLMNDVGGEVRIIMQAGERIATDLNAIVAGVRAGRGTVGKLVTDDALYANARRIADEAERAVANVRDASDQAKAFMADLGGDGGPMRGLTADFQQTLASARDAMSDLADTTEALKRNFFFRGFFNRRGYFDLDDVSLERYREGALATPDRRVLRIWVSAGVLFETDAKGVERLSDDGRARLDSAMSTFVKYPRNTPFVVEGYGQAPTADARHLVSRHRAQLVRDYLVGKFSLDPNFVATMPMGAQAEGSPAGDRWDGVALAMFVAASAM